MKLSDKNPEGSTSCPRMPTTPTRHQQTGVTSRRNPWNISQPSESKYQRMYWSSLFRGHYRRLLALASYLLLLQHLGWLAAQNMTQEVPGGSTEHPEVAETFSLALSLFEKRQPEQAIELFRNAFEADRFFLLAKAWEMRSYQALSLDRHASLVREQLLREQRGEPFLSWFDLLPPKELPVVDHSPRKMNLNFCSTSPALKELVLTRGKDLQSPSSTSVKTKATVATWCASTMSTINDSGNTESF